MSNEIAAFDSSSLTDILANESRQKGTKLINPKTNGLSFGYIPKNKTISEGEIFLTLGFAGRGVNRDGAFGARHIWEKHRKDLSLKAFRDVPNQLADILEEGAKVMVNPNKGSTERPLVLNSKHGTVILGKKEMDGVIEYHVISAYGKKDPRGFVIAEIKKPK